MAHDISQEQFQTWSARTLGGMIRAVMPPRMADEREGAELAIVRDERGDTILARLIGPLAGEMRSGGSWRVEARFRIDPGGEPISSLVSSVPDVDPPAGHDWGALGLPFGLATRVRRVEESPPDEVALALGSTGHRLGEATWWLTLAPGDRVTLGSESGRVLTVDRRKRTGEVEIDGEAYVVALDDLSIEENAE